ncbi:hypothetical protein C0991_011694 [Blastosporella zonata]|nr:hypothetical protein C0991_011694 [Blastosporella zonata]
MATTTHSALEHPTAFLPPLARLSSHSTEEVAGAMAKLRTLYWPPPLPAEITLPKRTISTSTRYDGDPDSGYASAEEEDDVEGTITHITAAGDSLDVLRADSLEREYAVRWTTGFISRSYVWIDAGTGDEAQAARAELLDDATALLSAFIGDANNEEEEDEEKEDEEPAMVRLFSFPRPMDPAIDVHLHDAPMLEDDHTSVGLQSWGSCIRFGRRICVSPTHFSLPPPQFPIHERPLRVLELGAGTGLLSILAAKLLQHLPHPPTVIATDYHPDVLANLSINVSANLPPSSSSPPQIQVAALDWETPTTTPPLNAPFDVILAADVIYHPAHARWIRGCVEKLLRQPSLGDPTSGGVFWMFNAVRQVGRHEGLAESVPRVFSEELDDEGKGEGENGVALRILEMEEAGKEAGVGRADECGYRLFRIGWVPVGGGGA